MEIIKLKDCKISKDIIQYNYKKWIEFHNHYKIIDINNITS